MDNLAHPHSLSQYPPSLPPALPIPSNNPSPPTSPPPSRSPSLRTLASRSSQSLYFPLDPPPNLNPDDNPHLEAIRRTNDTFRPPPPSSSSVVGGVRRALDSVIRTPRLRHAPSGRPKSASSHSLERPSSHEPCTCPSPRKARHPSLSARPDRRPSATSCGSARASVASSSATSTSSSSSASTWWRFWRDSSEASHSTNPHPTHPPLPRPQFTLLTPSLAHEPLQSRPFDSFSSPTITPALQRLLAFWHEGRQEADVADARSARPPPSRPAPDAPRIRLPKARRRALSPTHKLRFREDGRLSFHDDHTGQVEAPLAPPTRSAWWLDITSPTPADMDELRKVLPIHPLSIEDILHRDDREKTETFDGLGYYFVCFRGLERAGRQAGSSGEQEDQAGEQTDGCSKESMISRRRSKKRPPIENEIIEAKKFQTTPNKFTRTNDVEQVGLGAVNLYLVVFRDGIISFHFEELDQHMDRVKDRMQSLTSTTSSNPNTTNTTTTTMTTKSGGGTGLGEYISPHWIAYGLMDSIVDEFLPLLELVSEESGVLDSYLADPLREVSPGDRDRAGERAGMLSRITATRRLVVAMSRLMAQKHQTVEALRKRLMGSGGGGGHEGMRMGQSREIHLYLGDLQDHIVSMSQGLAFHDTLLANLHLAYLGLLRTTLGSTKQAQDVLIIRLYLITLLVLPMNTLIGLHSMNIHIPANGDMSSQHLRADGSRAPFYVFGAVVVGCWACGVGVVGVIKWVIGASEKRFGRRFPRLWST